ncbi:hypothetical protein ACJJTC_015491 [Scirpophaga incertulas]
MEKLFTKKILFCKHVLSRTWVKDYCTHPKSHDGTKKSILIQLYTVSAGADEIELAIESNNKCPRPDFHKTLTQVLLREPIDGAHDLETIPHSRHAFVCLRRDSDGFQLWITNTTF